MCSEHCLRVYSFLLENRPYFFASVDENGHARVRPFGSAILYEGRIYFGVGTHKASYRQALNNPNVELCAYNAGRQLWLRLRGSAVFDYRDEINEAVFAGKPHLRKKYSPESGLKMARFYLKDAVAEFLSNDGEFESFPL